MDLDLMINSFPKLLSASVITLKLLSVSLLIGLFLPTKASHFSTRLFFFEKNMEN